MDKLASRKLILTVCGVAIVALATFMGIEIPDETMVSIMGMVGAYVVGQGVVDAAEVMSAGKSLGEAAKGVANAASEVVEVAGE